MNHVVKRFWQAADTVLLVTTSENTAVMDSYASIKVFSASRTSKQVRVFVNCADEAAGKSVCARIERACQHFLGIDVERGGCLPRHRVVAEAACAREPFAVEALSEPSRLIDAVAESLLAQMLPASTAAVACAQ